MGHSRPGDYNVTHQGRSLDLPRGHRGRLVRSPGGSIFGAGGGPAHCGLGLRSACAGLGLPPSGLWCPVASGLRCVNHGRASASALGGSGQIMLTISISDRMPLPLERRLTLDVSARVARIVGKASNKQGES
jgi:hypothetical protein